MNILGIIPARGGSKGIPKKNLRKINKIPLIQFTIKTAKNSKINKLIVSTDDPKISKLAKSLKIDVPFLRPKNISQDKSSMIDVVKHTIKFLSSKKKYQPDIIVILQPTSPLRTTKMINDSIDILQKTNATSVISVSETAQHPFSTFSYNTKYLKPFFEKFEKYNRRQLYPTLYNPNGSIYTFWTKTLLKYNSLYGPRIKPLIIKDKTSVDIDDVFDLFVTEMILLHWKDYSKSFKRMNKKLNDNKYN